MKPHADKTESLTQGGPPRAVGDGSRDRALVLVPELKSRGVGQADDQKRAHRRNPQARLDEAVGLAAAIDLDIVHAGLVLVSAPKAGTFFRSGKIEEVAAIVRAEDAGLVIVDTALTPVQQRNLEKAWQAKVIDRTGLILEIFGRRAKTKEGVLQVELAHLNYQKSRLVRSWTHLERQRGGFGFLGGPGETQIEADRRQLQERISRIETQLEQVRGTRGLHRKGRQRVPYPIVALVGYTNAGKSTLFNALTEANVRAEDLLFATLDPAMRTMTLPQGGDVILSDTVGFISDLPTHLIAAFRATLEEVLEADIVLHVRDISHEDTDAQADDVADVLEALGIDPDAENIVEVWNKSDLLSDRALDAVTNQATRPGRGGRTPILVSAITGDGLDRLRDEIGARIAADHVSRQVRLPSGEGATLNWVYEHCDVIGREDSDDGLHVTLDVRVPPRDLAAFERRLGAE